MTSEAVESKEIVLSVGDTTYLDYGSIKAQREGSGPTGKGGNGLILHSALAITPEQGQVIRFNYVFPIVSTIVTHDKFMQLKSIAKKVKPLWNGCF
jgi:hypothetical protein